MKDANHGPRVVGKNYLETIANIHTVLTPRSYFEVGVQFGNTLELAKCETVAVDPYFVCAKNIIGRKPRCFLYQQTSDGFFKETRPSKVLGKPVDLAFLDGMHLFEFLLRDFINTERECAKDSIILMHDCLPPGYKMTIRDMKTAIEPTDNNFPGWWAGDVWKMVPTLLKYRPDLSVTVTDCAPTGLVVVTNLNPESTVLRDAYDEILKTFRADSRDEYDDYWKSVKIVRETALNIAARHRPFA
ncbi:class I SAM-dependent methyltransferase [Mesorhizobium neociceri]|uniref:Class I SAM-dependent methyltransferase n=1 Tax=Mesorhizobium neociceri TaxID=1307853 RepID=A0A838B5V2_9HYPH|nr:class I SAM-dependent methyltransferase [Mesorhizobium neociceri]MBA1141381.1 class I SAM-dependent methyltransferase [Mesorhizobium neociceri]